jgi:hypothetical protein
VAYKPPQNAPPPQPPASGSKRKRKPEKTPEQVAARGVKISEARERLTHSEFNQQWNYYNEIYQAYAGRNATQKEARVLISNGVSRTTLALHLAKQPAFFKSPIWKSKSDALLGAARTIGVKIPKQFIARAIANNWDEANFTEKLRKLPQYLQSNEFQTTTAGLTNAYKSLYGHPDVEWAKEIQRAALGRWTPEQWQKYLRAQPNYRNSTEYQSNLQSLQAQLGFLPGQTDEPLIPGAKPKPPPPSKRVR